MILVDFSQIILGSIITNLSNEAKSSNPAGKGMIKHMFFSTLLQYKKKFSDYGEIILCCDGKQYWRKDYFPHYKGKRKEQREKSPLDWDFIFATIDELKREIRENFRFKLIEVHSAEGDDVIAVLTKYFQTNELLSEGLFDDEPQPILLLSSDGDYVQLQKYKNVKQFSPMQRKFVVPKTSLKNYITEHIVKAGDDGIPNILSSDDCFMKGVRQTPIKKAYLDNFLIHGESACTTEMEKRNWKRNQTLIDFDYIPPELSSKIIDTYKTYEVKGTKTKVMNYFLANKMKVLFGELSHF